jgi:hypothetical protein
MPRLGFLGFCAANSVLSARLAWSAAVAGVLRSRRDRSPGECSSTVDGRYGGSGPPGCAVEPEPAPAPAGAGAGSRAAAGTGAEPDRVRGPGRAVGATAGARSRDATGAAAAHRDPPRTALPGATRVDRERGARGKVRPARCRRGRGGAPTASPPHAATPAPGADRPPAHVADRGNRAASPIGGTVPWPRGRVDRVACAPGLPWATVPAERGGDTVRARRARAGRPPCPYRCGWTPSLRPPGDLQLRLNYGTRMKATLTSGFTRMADRRCLLSYLRGTIAG